MRQVRQTPPGVLGVRWDFAEDFFERSGPRLAPSAPRLAPKRDFAPRAPVGTRSAAGRGVSAPRRSAAVVREPELRCAAGRRFGLTRLTGRLLAMIAVS